jgi:Zn-dependent M28 family amino/carboxypeptidase
MEELTIEDCLNQISPNRIGNLIRALEGIRHPKANLAALERAADTISAALKTYGYEVATQLFTAGENQYRNIIATRAGVHFPDQRVMVVAHYDTVSNSPGADDNASGVAVLLELAAVLKSLSFERSVQFIAVNLEERQREGPLDEAGLFGSRALVSRAVAEGWKIEGAVVLESIAYAGKTIAQKSPQGLPLKVPETGDFIAVVGNQASEKMVEAFTRGVKRYQISLPVLPLVVPGAGEMLPDTRRSDHAPFWDAGYKAIMITDTTNFRNPHYHQPTDTYETLNVPFAVEVCRAVTVFVGDLAGTSSTATSSDGAR